VTEIATGLALGFGAGISPGPLLTLVLTSTLERGFGAGLRVALAPLMTDAPIVALSVGAVSSVGEPVLRGLALTGGIIVVGLGVHTVAGSARSVSSPQQAVAGPGYVWRGILVNLASPHPWIFWLSAGAPLLVAAWRRAPLLGVAFLAAFYGLLVGSKIAIAWGVARGRERLSPRRRRRLLIAGGIALVVGGGALVWQAAAGRL
jgi:threonine/homoserine/homoserine lactone efflux protein